MVEIFTSLVFVESGAALTDWQTRTLIIWNVSNWILTTENTTEACPVWREVVITLLSLY